MYQSGLCWCFDFFKLWVFFKSHDEMVGLVEVEYWAVQVAVSNHGGVKALVL